MTKKNSSILFITPGASKVGGNIFLLDFLKWFKRNSDIPFLTVYGHGGELEKEFAALNPAFRFDEEYSYRGFFKGNYKRLLHLLELKKRRLQRELKKHKVGLIYANAVTNYEVLSSLPFSNVPVISHCHELESVIHRTGLEGFEKTKQLTDQFIAVSHAVKDNLIKNQQVAEDKISVIHGFIPIKNYSEASLDEKRKKVLQELNLPQNAFIVGASGTIYWRKAPDIFIQIARQIHRKQPELPIYFVWIGGAPKGDFRFFEMNYDIENLELQNRVHFLEHKSDPTDYFAALDVFAMTSREDPFPLVCLETAALGKPVICFDKTGGMPEFIEEDSGFVVPYLDVEAFADKITTLFYDKKLSKTLGNRAAQKIRERHDLETSAPKVLEIIEKYGHF